MPGRRHLPFRDHQITVLLILYLIALAPADISAQEKRSGAAYSSSNPIHVDGVLDESAWTSAPVIAGFRQKDPHEGEASTESTEIRILYTSKSFFLAIRCFDSEPDRVLATELRRDNEFTNDDSVSILLDTLHDHRNAFLFRVNPHGKQYDALITDEGRIVDVNWDESWKSAAKIDPSGWSVEVEIPFRALRLSGSKEQVWGIDFERVIRRKSEFTYWSNYRRGFDFIKCIFL